MENNICQFKPQSHQNRKEGKKEGGRKERGRKEGRKERKRKKGKKEERKKTYLPGTVAHICNPSYLGD
jgi:hypothetical protein